MKSVRFFCCVKRTCALSEKDRPGENAASREPDKKGEAAKKDRLKKETRPGGRSEEDGGKKSAADAGTVRPGGNSFQVKLLGSPNAGGGCRRSADEPKKLSIQAGQERNAAGRKMRETEIERPRGCARKNGRRPGRTLGGGGDRKEENRERETEAEAAGRMRQPKGEMRPGMERGAFFGARDFVSCAKWGD